MPKVYLGAIAWRNYEAEFVRCLVALIKEHPTEIAFSPQVGDALVERARSVVATHFLEQTDCDVLLTIDSDITFEPSAAWQICEQAMTHDIVVGIYNCRSVKGAPASIIGDDTIEFAFDSTPVPIRWGATGFMAVHRRVLEKMVRQEGMEKVNASADWGCYPFYHTEIVEDEVGGRILLSEDYAFCERAKQDGFQVYANPSVRLGHVGQYVYRLEDIMTNPMAPMPLKMTRQGFQVSGDKALKYKVEGAVQEVSPNDLRFKLDSQDAIVSKTIRETGKWEPDVMEVLKRNLTAESTFLDLGAHIGFHTLMASRRCKAVIAVEAQPRIATILRDNMNTNHIDNIELHTVAVTDYIGQGSMVLDPRFKNDNGVMNSGAFYFDPEDKGSYPVQCTRLANILQGRYPDVIKADIEGWEYRVLKDNPDVLKNARVIIFEYSPAQNERFSEGGDIFKLLRDAGFEVTQTNGQAIEGLPEGEQWQNFLALKTAPVSRQQRRALARSGGK